MNLIRRYPEFFALTLLAFITRLWGVASPAAVVFDEVYFKAYAGDYFTGAYYFDIHPPLGKLLLAGWAKLAHIDPAALTGTGPAVMLRVLPAVAGALIIPVFYIFMRTLGAPRRLAAFGAALLLLENALLVESRFILIDSMLILFGLSAVTCYLTARHRAGLARVLLLCASAILAGLAASTKWTGLTALGLIGLVWLYDQIRWRKQFTWPKRLSEAVILVLLPGLVYLGVFFVHFSLLPNTGQGDAFMPEKFQATLKGNPAYDPSAHLSFTEKFFELNLEMITSENGLKTATHPYSSKWISWPIMERPVYYWQGETLTDGRQGNIYLLGNPVVWWGILMVIIGGVLASKPALARLKPYRFALGFLGAGYLMNFLPFSGIVRVMFLYHYFFALIYSLAFAVILLGGLCGWTDDKQPWHFPSPTSRSLYFGALAAAVAGFLYFAPLSYGTPLSPQQIEQHMWLRSWR
jgi:dolichyl-phosphate-mannose-protein mannosyltransferase